MRINALNQRNTKQLEQKKKETVRVEKVIMINGKVKR